MAEGKKGKKKVKQSLSEFLGDKPTSWADDEVEFPPEEKHQQQHESGARNASSWRDGGSQEQSRPFQSTKLPDSPPFSLHIGNLSYEAKESTIADFFGVPESAVRLVRDRTSNQCKGFGYVEFSTKDELSASLRKNGENVQGRAIRVELASENRGGGGRGGDRGGDRGGRGGFKQFGRDGSGGGGGFDSVGGGGRDWMGTATTEAAPERGPRSGGGGGGYRNFEGRGGFDRDRGGKDSWRDSEEQERQPPPPSSGRDSSWRDSEDRRQTRPTPSFTRDAMGSEAPATSSFSRGDRDEEGGRGRGRGRGFAARNNVGDTWAEGRDAMGTGVVEERPPPRARPEREAGAGLSRDAMQTDASPEQNERPERQERQERRPFRGRGGLSFSTANVPSREGFGADRVPERKPDKWRDSNENNQETVEEKEDNDETEENEEAAEQPTPPRPKRAPASSGPSPSRPSPSKPSAQSAPAPPPKAKKSVPLTPQELFAQQQQKELRKRQQQEEATNKQKPQQLNANPWEALNKTKKKKNKNKKKATTEEGEEEGGEEAEAEVEE